jgi:hypothetical protein
MRKRMTNEWCRLDVTLLWSWIVIKGSGLRFTGGSLFCLDCYVIVGGERCYGVMDIIVTFYAYFVLLCVDVTARVVCVCNW